MAKVTTKVKPLGDRLLIRPEDREATTASGLVLPDTAKEKPQEGQIVAVGKGKAPGRHCHRRRLRPRDRRR